jgi:Ser/Thr protein kinase RdoA (MazF antagonist)
MPKYTAAQIKAKKQMAKKVLAHHFGKSVKNIEFNAAGKTNFVFSATTKEGDFIVKIAFLKTKYKDFLKEQWAIQKAHEAGVPVAEILEVGDEIIPFPYLLQKKVKGTEAIHHHDRLEILKKLGKYARIIHSIRTEGYGSLFDWSKNKLPKKKTWIEFLENELRVTDGLKFLDKHSILSKKKIKHLNSEYEKIRKWKITPSLNHCDLRLKNVIANDKGDIKAIIDWDNCASNIAPYWDFSIALHDLSIDAKQKFLEGYEMDIEDFRRKAFSLTVFNIINYIPALQQMVDKKDTNNLALYKLRLDGSLDLFSL